MRPRYKGMLFSFLSVIGFIVLCFGVIAFLSGVLNDQNTPWVFVILIWMGTPLIMSVLVITGIIKYVRTKSEFGIGLLLGQVLLIGLGIVGGILFSVFLMFI